MDLIFAVSSLLVDILPSVTFFESLEAVCSPGGLVDEYALSHIYGQRSHVRGNQTDVSSAVYLCATQHRSHSHSQTDFAQRHSLYA